MSERAHQPGQKAGKSSLKLGGRTMEQGAGERAGIRLSAIVLIFFVLAAALGAFWYSRGSKRTTMNGVEGREPSGLSDSTKAVLKRLDSPVTIRFYALLDPGSVSDSVQAFAGRVDQLLSEYQREADGRIEVTRFNARADIDAIAVAAAADGIKPFNLEKGVACYLGLTVARNERKEPLSQLAPEWEQALEFDLTRAIARVIESKPSPGHGVDAASVDPAAVAEVKRLIPDRGAVSFEEGNRILREAALREFTSAVREMEAQVKKAEQQVLEAQKGKSEAEQQAALKQLERVRAEQAEKVRQSSGRSQARTAAWRQLQETPR